LTLSDPETLAISASSRLRIFQFRLLIPFHPSVRCRWGSCRLEGHQVPLHGPRVDFQLRCHFGRRLT
jgi:hypothetical protein